MKLSMTGELAAAYKSGSQRARVVTEFWGEKNLFCPNCSSPKLTWLKPGYPASDYSCPKCGFWYQLKSQRSPIRNSIADGAYSAMMAAIQNDKAPSYYFMQYDLATWSVRNLLLVPHFAFPPSAIIKRKPLSPTARRAGWIGCNFALNRIPIDARIAVVTESLVTSASEVREKFQRVKPLGEITAKERGWTLDVLNIVRRLSESRRRGDDSLNKKSPGQPESLRLLTSSPTTEFTNEDVYVFTRELEKLHPDNRHVKDKIRQQLQVLRDTDLLLHVSSGVWRLPLKVGDDVRSL
jgi:type II restriction enzyme